MEWQIFNFNAHIVHPYFFLQHAGLVAVEDQDWTPLPKNKVLQSFLDIDSQVGSELQEKGLFIASL